LIQYFDSIWGKVPENKDTDLKRDETLELFSGKKGFISFHERNIFEFEAIRNLLLE